MAGLVAVRSEAPRSAGWLVDRSRRLLIAAVVAAITPILVAAIRAATSDWFPAGDHAFAAIRSEDVFSRYPPLLGYWASASNWTGHEINMPGPMLFVALAVPVRLFGSASGLAVGMGLINVVAVVAVAWLAQRRGGYAFAAITMLFVASLELAFGSDLLFDPWGQYSPLLMFLVLLFAVWSAADGDLVALPVLAVAGSFVTQVELAFVVIGPVLVLWAIVMFVLAARGDRRRAPDDWPARKRRAWRYGAVALVLLVLSWLPPLWEQVFTNPGNITNLWRSAGTGPPNVPGVSGALHAVGGMLLVPPWWLPPSFVAPPFRSLGRGTAHPLPVLAVGLVALVAVGAWLAVQARRLGDRTSWTGLATAAAAVVVGFVSVARSGSPVGLNLGYVRWLWPLSMFVWLVVLRAGWRVLAARTTILTRPDRWATLTRTAATPVLGLGLLALVVANLPSRDNGSATQAWTATASRDLNAEVVPHLEHRGTVLVEMTLEHGPLYLGPALMVGLRDHQIPFVVDAPDLIRQLGPRRKFEGDNATTRILVGPGRLRDRHPHWDWVGYYPSLDRAQLAEFRRRSEQIQARLDALGSVRLTPQAEVGLRRLRARHPKVAAIALDTQRSLASGQLVKLWRADALDPKAFAGLALGRFAELQDQYLDLSVAVARRPLPQVNHPHN